MARRRTMVVLELKLPLNGTTHFPHCSFSEPCKLEPHLRFASVQVPDNRYRLRVMPQRKGGYIHHEFCDRFWICWPHCLHSASRPKEEESQQAKSQEWLCDLQVSVTWENKDRGRRNADRNIGVENWSVMRDALAVEGALASGSSVEVTRMTDRSDKYLQQIW